MGYKSSADVLIG